MPVEAKVSPNSAGINAAPAQAVEGSIAVPAGSNVALNVAPEAVAGYGRDGADLLVHLKSGELVRITNFYIDPTKVSHLLLVNENGLVTAEVGQVTTGAMSSATYVPIDATAGFSAPAVGGAGGAGATAGAAAGAGGGALGAGTLIPLAVLGGGGLVAAAATGGGNKDNQPAPTPDTTAPAAATNLAINAAGDRLTGSAEAGATVNVDVDGNGTSDYSATVGANGTFSVALAPTLVDGETVRVTVRDPAGNVGPVASVTAPDTTAPEPAEVTIAADGTGISGTGEPGSIVSVDVDQDGDIDYTTEINADGTFSITFVTQIDNGQPIDVTITDAAGNASEPVTVTAPDLFPTPTTAPILGPTNGSVLSGTAASGVAVLLTDAQGGTIGQATIGVDGTWTFTPTTPLPNGAVITAAAVNAVGEAGPAASVTVDAVAPTAPVISPSNGLVITGLAEAGTTVRLTNGGGDPLGQAIAGIDGRWNFEPAQPLADGTTVHAIAVDASGNGSAQATVIVDAMAPALPTIAPPNASSISGSAEPGSTVLITDGNGDPIGQTTADNSGNWTFTPAAQLADGTVVNVVAQDAAGNVSASASAVVDAVPPATPVINPSNGTTFNGTAEPGSTVILTDGNGNPVGQVIADIGGNWSFTPVSPLPNGTVIAAVAIDAAGNASVSANTTIDAIAPAAPTIAPSNGSAFAGTSEPGSTVTLIDGNGNLIGQVTADGGGNWNFTPSSPLPDGTVINAIAQDAAGNVGGPVSITVDAVAPPSPIIDPSDGSEISGTAEAGALVILSDGNGNPIGEATADGGGFWSYLPASPLPGATVINAVAQDAAGNTSGPSSTTVDVVPPIGPTINPTDGSELTGTAEPNSTVILMEDNGNPFARSSIPGLGVVIGETTADGTGHWTFTPLIPLPHGTVVIAISVDAAGNFSSTVNTVVDTVSPSVPTIDPTNGLGLEGTSEIGATIVLTDSLGNTIGQTTADGSGHWSFTPQVPLLNGVLVNAIAFDGAGNASLPASTIVDAIVPATPSINASNGSTLMGMAEPGATVILSTLLGGPLAEVMTDLTGHWSYTPALPLPNATTVIAIAQDAVGNNSLPAVTTVDSLAPTIPILVLSLDGGLLSGFAEPNSQLSVVINGDIGHPIVLTVSPGGNFALPLLPPLVSGETISATASDAIGNQSLPATIIAPDIAPPTILVPEAADSWINAAEAADGIQVEVAIRPTMQVGQVITAQFDGQNGYQAQAIHVIGAGDIALGRAVLSILPSGLQGPLPNGASSIAAHVGAGASSAPSAFIIDTTPPANPVLALTNSLLTISAEPNSELNVNIDLGGITAHAELTADNSGLASLNLLTDLDIDLGWDQLLAAQVSVIGEDAAGNASNVATLSILPNIVQPLTIGNFAVDANLNLLDPHLGISGTTDPNSIVAIRVITPLLNVQLLPIVADNTGHFELNLLDPNILTQLGLNISGILALGSDISLNLVATDGQGHDSAAYGLDLTPAGLSLNLGEITVGGTSSDDIMSGANGSVEHIDSGSGNDLIFNVGTGDHVSAGNADDTIQVTSPDFATVNGGAGFDTVLLANGIDIDYNGLNVGTLDGIERIDLGSGDSGSALTLTASEVDAITDPANILQITGESNDVLNIAGAVDTSTTQSHDGIVFDVYTFGTSTVLVEDNSVQVVV